MKKIYLNTILGLFVGMSSLNANAMTYRDNDVFLNPLGHFPQVNEGHFKVNDFSITNGQDPQKYIQKGKIVTLEDRGKYGWRFRFTIGRKKSKEVANWFNSIVPPEKNSFGHTAGELNFALQGDLLLNIQTGPKGENEKVRFEDIVFAQGNAGASNNWWFGGESCRYMGDHIVRCTGTTQGPDVKSVDVHFRRGNQNSVNSVEIWSYNEVEMDTKAWMKGLDGNLMLSQIMLPGSHDAGMSELSSCGPIGSTAKAITKTQFLPVREQLDVGVRYFDIRPSFRNGILRTTHRSLGVGCDGEKIKPILEGAVQFLKKYPTELVIMKLSHVDYPESKTKDEMAKAIRDIDFMYPGILLKSSNYHENIAKMPLDELRGKLIIVQDYQNHLEPVNRGTHRYRDGFSNNQCNYVQDSNLTVCDDYANTASYSKMAQDQIRKWNQSVNGEDDRLFLLSWTVTPTYLDMSLFQRVTEVNTMLPKVLKEQIEDNGANLPQIVYIDYVDRAPVSSIIKYNFQR